MLHVLKAFHRLTNASRVSLFFSIQFMEAYFPNSSIFRAARLCVQRKSRLCRKNFQLRYIFPLYSIKTDITNNKAAWPV